MSITITPHPSSRDDTKQLYSVRAFDYEITATVTAAAFDVNEWLQEIRRIHFRRLRRLVVGLDVEWRPNFNRNVENPVAILQLCVGRSCLIFQLLHADSIPRSLIDFLANGDFTFVGVGIKADVEKLLEDYNLNVSHTVDLRDLAAETLEMENLKRAGLKGLAMAVLHLNIHKPKSVTMSRWDYRFLRWDQVQYACVDAFLSFEMGRQLLNGGQ